MIAAQPGNISFIYYVFKLDEATARCSIGNIEQWLPLTCPYTPMCLGLVLSAHSCSRSLLPRETEYSFNFASACRSLCEALLLSSSQPFSRPVSHWFSLLFDYHTDMYPLVSDVSPPPFILRCHIYFLFVTLFYRYPAS